MIGIAVVGCGLIDAMQATDIAVYSRFRLIVRDINGAAAQTDAASTGASVIHAAVEVFSMWTQSSSRLRPMRTPISRNKRSHRKGSALREVDRPELGPVHGDGASDNGRPHQMLLSGKRRSNHEAPLVHFSAERGRRALVLAEAALKSIADGRAVKVSEVS
jgi:hypothetical protein